VLAHHGLSRNTQDILVRSGRQVGKTTAIRCFAAAALLSVPDLIIAVCAPSLTQSKSVLGPVKDAVKQLLPGLRAQGEEWILEPDNMTQLGLTRVYPDGTRNTRSIQAYPGNETVCLCDDGRRFHFAVVSDGARLQMRGGESGMGEEACICEGVHESGGAQIYVKRLYERSLNGPEHAILIYADLIYKQTKRQWLLNNTTPWTSRGGPGYCIYYAAGSGPFTT